MVRYDLRAVSGLSTEITKWTPRCDLRLHRLMSYINHTIDLRLYGWVGDSIDAFQLNLYVDADLAGDTPSCKSTSGVFFAVLWSAYEVACCWTVEEATCYFAQHA